ncbi:hypothetical protein ACJ41O_009251 [Fusarium nematophilum]
MPTATEYFGSAITNFGPLTTTYTAPSSCATPGDYVYFAPSRIPEMVQGFPSCGVPTLGDCIPSGDDYDELLSTLYETWGPGFHHYYSPGLYCPDGWTTAATMVQESGEDAEITGFMTEVHGDPRLTTVPAFMEPSDIYKAVLGPDETLAICCPSGYTGNRNGDCYSVLGPATSFSYTERCLAVFRGSGIVTVISTVDGTAVTPGYLVQGTAKAWPDTISGTIEQTGSETVVVTQIPGVPLVFKASDLEDGGSSEGSGDDDNAAAGGPAMGGIFPVLAVVFSMLAGAGLLVPW